ncbi:gliding motility-associated-like protein [Flavobacterium cutihirudinis]|uniref:Gliding motility-associated-like protein n=1 Tax=Flavobacterium cutihirudinis TaxID=1265740 RepID=A0A3D9FVN5_9FLAO|nr:T9SS type B sorting domain-containing protein [Flavobacterium cutihirudinis]RED24829.1 gliding motility-associated-like protein [Flavobacterium cutihirudinis]
MLLFFVSFSLRAQFPFSESFKNATAPGMIFGGSPTAFLTGGAGSNDGYNDPIGNGYLRLTSNRTNQKGLVWWDNYSFPSAYGMNISFEYYDFGGSGADGISFILFDAAAPLVTAGAYGGSLGYAQSMWENGFSKGYLGIGIDEYGNFASNNDWKIGGVSQTPSNITLRGDENSGYNHLTTAATSPYGFNVSGYDRNATDASNPQFRKIDISLKPRSAGGFFIDVYITHGSSKTLIINNYEYTTLSPDNLKIAIASSTGNVTNFHEIRNLEINVDLSTLLTPVAVADSFSGCIGLPATSEDITANDNGTVNRLGTINKESIDLDPSIDGIQTTKSVTGKGTFAYDYLTGKVTFMPVDNTVMGPVSINYTFNDSYGKTSNATTLTYNIYTPISNNNIQTLVPDYCENTGNNVLVEGTNPVGGNLSFTFQWEKSLNNITFQSIPGATDKNYSPPNTNITTYYRRITTSESCSTSSNVVSIIVNTSIATPSLTTSNHPTCNNSNGSFTITNYDSRNTYIISPSTGVIQNAETITAPAGNYTVTAKLGNCESSPAFTSINAQPITPAPPTLSAITQPTSTSDGSFTILNYDSTYTYVFNPSTGVSQTGNRVTAPEGDYTISAKLDNCTSTTQRFIVNTPICEGEMHTIIKDDFGSGASDYGPRPSMSDFSTTYNFSPSGTVASNGYSLIKNPKLGNNAWSSGGDHNTGRGGDGYMLIFDANNVFGSVFYEKKYSNLCSGSLCKFSIYAANLVPTTYTFTTIKPIIKIDLINPANGMIIKSITSNELPLSQQNLLLWNELSLSFTIPLGLDSVTLRVSNAQTDTNTNGNDVAFDDVSFSICVPVLTLSTASEKICSGESNTITSALNNTPSVVYNYQWQQFNGTAWEDIPGATLTQYETPALFENKKYRIRYAPAGIDITNNNNLGCSGIKEVELQVTPRAKAQDIVLSSNYPVCEGSQITLTPTSNVGTNFYWYDGPTNSATLLSNNSSYSTGILTTSKTYYLAVSGTNYCENTPEDRRVVTVTLNLKPANEVTDMFVCAGGSYKWIDGVTYTTSQNGLRINNDGCTADKVLNLTVGTKPADEVTDMFVCAGGSYKWIDGVTYTTSQNGLRINNDGCTADKVLNLTVGTKPADEVTDMFVCAGGSFKWIDGVTYTTSQNGLRINNDGCTADKVLNLTVGTKPADEVTDMFVCAGGSFKWIDGVTYTTSQNGLRINNDGCTADKVLNLTVGTKPADEVTDMSVCAGGSFKWIDGVTYTTSQNGLRINNDGCTADKVLNLTVGTKPADEVTDMSVCAGGSFKWIDGVTYTTSQNGLRINNDGCTADKVLNLTVGTKPADEVTDMFVCAGGSFKWIDGVTYTTSQNGLRINNDGCTADQVLNLAIALPLNSSVITGSIIPELCYNDNNGSFSIEITGGILPYEVSLNNNEPYKPVTGSEYTFNEITGTNQIVKIKDALNCTVQLEVTMPDAILLDPITEINYDCETNNSVKVKLDLNITDLENVDYALDNGTFQSDNIFTNVPSGTHTITARHLNGCTKNTPSFTIDQVEPLSVKLSDGELNEIVATAFGGFGNYQFSFEGEQTHNNKLIIYKSGIYTVTVIDNNGCTATASRYFEYIDVCIPNYFTPNGDGISDEWGPDCSTNYKNLTFSIFDRYGRKVANYHYGQKWDGKYNGAELTSGDYWYVIKLNDPKDDREFVGHFTLYR